MAGHHTQFNSICLRAPDDFLSGLLCIVFAASDSRCDGALDTYPAQEACWYLVGVSGGSARITCDKGCLFLESGQLLAVCAESPMDVLFHGTGELSVLCLKGKLAGDILRQSEILGGSLYPNGGAPLAEALDQLHQAGEAEDVPAPFASSQAYQLLMALYGTGSMAIRNEKQLPQVVEAALKILQQDYAFLDGIGDLADRLEVSQEYLTRTFRDHMGITPGKYLVQVRVEQAKLLLQQGDHSVAFVADACGFTNGNYFARVFRSIVGVTPSVYAREQAGQNPLPHPVLDAYYVL